MNDTPTQVAPFGASELLWCAEIDSKQYWNDVPLPLQAGTRYYLRATGEWLDWHNPGDANGYDKSSMNWAKGLLRFQAPQATWFTLIGSIDRQRKSLFIIGDGSRWKEGWVAPQSGQLSCYANDVPGFYWNNKGTVTLEIWR
ncbi:hypothetical protein [Pseudomonas sp. NPDC089569]|uniref:hypothetical protein n=1 Tax=Pseudomonas sp. NPDC089569 TaxID=3390722 RepID=UPI003D02B966